MTIEELYQEHADTITRAVFGRLRVRNAPRQEIEDIASSVWMYAVEHRGVVEGHPAPIKYLVMKAGHLVIDQYRRHTYRQTGPLHDDVAENLIDHRPGTEDEALGRVAVREVVAAINTLSATDRASLAMAAAGWSIQKVATDLGLSYGAAKTRPLRARRRLRAALLAG